MALLDRLTLHGEALEVACLLLRDERVASWPELLERLMPFGGSDEAKRELRASLDELQIAAVDGDDIALTPMLDSNTNVRLWILERLMDAQGSDAAVLHLYRWLLQDERFAKRVLERDEVWPVYNQSHPDGQAPLVFNTPKMASWLRLMSFIGLVSPERSNSFVLSPTLQLVRALLRETAVRLEQSGELALADMARWIEARYCPIQQHPGRLHPGFADALDVLAMHGEIELVMLGDAAALFAGRRRISHIRLLPGAA